MTTTTESSTSHLVEEDGGEYSHGSSSSSSTEEEAAAAALSTPPPSQSMSSSSNIIPESLLSLAKDERYIYQCQNLLEQVMESFSFLFYNNSSDSNSDNSGGNEEERRLVLKRRTWLMSYLLYALLVVIPDGKTLGMDALSLQYHLIGQSNGNGTTAITTRINQLALRNRLMAMMLFTVGGGWVLDRLLVELKRRSTSRGNGASNNNPSLTGPTPLSIASSNTNNNNEHLRGQDRREQFERLRRQMLERSNRLSNNQQASDRSGNDGNHPVSNQHHRQDDHQSATLIISRNRFYDRVQNWTQQVSRSLLDALFYTEGPHQVTHANTTDNNNNNTLWDGISSSNTNIDSYSLARWLVRLHLAQYLISGKYPSWIHRFFGLTMEPKSQNNQQQQQQQSSSVIPIRPDNSHRIVALLIVLQASSSLIRRVWNGTAESMADFLEQRRRRQRSQRQQQEPGAEFRRQQFQQSMAQYFDEEDIKQHNTNKKKSEQGNFADVKIDTDDSCNDHHHLCTICRTRRDYPAASVNCGHVCCWDCLMNWVTNVRSECPLCRTPCEPQDIMILHEYA